ncbi:unnamed protein product [Rhizophagus irregularis]|nr:unnamed protein product [Rhizophagus irregularis]CAB5365101.1 unnamed protein product [Rhizophagus irregularis]
MLTEKVLNKLANTKYWRQSYTQWDVISYLKKYSNDTKEERRAYSALGTELRVLFKNLKPKSKEGQKVRILKRQLKELKEHFNISLYNISLKLTF